MRGDSHYCAPEVLDFCRANRLDYILGVAPTSTLRRRIEGLEVATKTQYETTPGNGKARQFKEFYDGAASWSRVERVIARVEVGAQGPDTRFVVTNLQQRNARRLYEDVYCRRGQAENHIKSWKTHLAADRTSCTKASARRGPFHHCCAAPGQTPRRQGDQGLSAPPAARHSRQLASGRHRTRRWVESRIRRSAR